MLVEEVSEYLLPTGFNNAKACTICKNIKPFLEFNKCKNGRFGLQSKCMDCGREACRSWYNKNIEQERERCRIRSRINGYGPKQREQNRRWAAANPEKARYLNRKKLFRTKYNLTVEEHEAIFASQGFACAACGSTTPNSKKGWSTDHCHATGAVRGILCHHCNVGLGHAKDNPQTLRAWVSYLERGQIVKI